MLILKKYNLILIVFLLVLFCSCYTPRYYTPNINPVPLFKDKGDIYMNASTNFLNKGSATIGASPFDGMGMYAGVAGAYEGSKSKHYSPNPPSNLNYIYHRYKGGMANFGAGYYLNNDNSEHFRFEIYGDFAFGSYQNMRLSSPSNFTLDSIIKGRYNRIGLLTNIGYNSPNENFSIAYTCRLSHLNFSDPTIIGKYDWKNEMAKLNNKSGYGYDLMEHGISICKGDSDIKYQTQISLFHGFNSRGNTYDALQNFNFSINFGVSFKINYDDL